MANHPTLAIRCNDSSAGHYNCQGMRLFFTTVKALLIRVLIFTENQCFIDSRMSEMLGGIYNRQIISCLRTIMQCSLQTV